MSIRRGCPASSMGFTLIELLVVIAIIGLLASIVLASLSTAKSKGQDAARISDVNSLEIAMEIYFNDFGHYPDSSCVSGLVAGQGTAIGNLSCLVPKYITSIPALLISDGDHYVWGGSSYGYGIEVFNLQTGTCKAGVNMNSSWWNPPGISNCSF